MYLSGSTGGITTVPVRNAQEVLINVHVRDPQEAKPVLLSVVTGRVNNAPVREGSV